MVNPCPMIPSSSCAEPLPLTPVHRAISSCISRVCSVLKYITAPVRGLIAGNEPQTLWSNTPADTSRQRYCLIPMQPEAKNTFLIALVHFLFSPFSESLQHVKVHNCTGARSNCWRGTSDALIFAKALSANIETTLLSDFNATQGNNLASLQ